MTDKMLLVTQVMMVHEHAGTNVVTTRVVSCQELEQGEVLSTLFLG